MQSVSVSGVREGTETVIDTVLWMTAVGVSVSTRFRFVLRPIFTGK